MILKRIFYVWGANEPKKVSVLACMQSWRQNCPDYDIIEINELTTEYFNFQKELEDNRWFRTVYDRKMWAYVSDYIRIKVLYDNGGIYLDTDVSVIKPFDSFLSDPLFVGMQDSSCDGADDLTEPAILGGQKGNKFLEEVYHFYDNDIWNEPIFTMPQIFKHFLSKRNCPEFSEKNKQKIIRLGDIYIYPERYFIPFRYRGLYTPNCVENDTHTIHWFNGSWVKPDVTHFLQNKHLIRKNEYPAHVNPSNIKYETYYLLNLFKYLRLLKITRSEDNSIVKIKYYLFGILPLLYREKHFMENKCVVKLSLWKILPLYRIKEKEDYRKYYLFYLLPIISIKR